MAESPEIERYRHAWEDRRRRRNALVAMVGALAVLLVVWPQPVVAALWGIATLAAGWRFASFRCPRCDDTFMSVPDAMDTWPRYGCSRCRLPIDALPD